MCGRRAAGPPTGTGCPHGHARSSGDRLQHGVDVAGGRQNSCATDSRDSKRLASMSACSRRTTTSCSRLAWTEEVGSQPTRIRHRPSPWFWHLQLVHVSRFHAEQDGELRQCAERVVTEQPVSGVVRGDDADEAVGLVDVDDLGPGDRRLLGRDAGIGVEHLGGDPIDRKRARTSVPAYCRNTSTPGLPADGRVAEDLGRCPEEREPLLVGAPAVGAAQVGGSAAPPARASTLATSASPPTWWTTARSAPNIELASSWVVSGWSPTLEKGRPPNRRP